MQKDSALVIIDVQIGLMEEAYQRDEILARIQTLQEKARAASVPIIYVQHDGPVGDSLEVGTPTWRLHPALAPQADEPVVHKRASDAFHDTRLREELDKRGIKHLVVAGGQTEYCIDTSIRRATTCGYDVTLVGDAHTTYDNHFLTAAQSIGYHNELLNGFQTDNYAILVKPTASITF